MVADSGLDPHTIPHLRTRLPPLCSAGLFPLNGAQSGEVTSAGAYVDYVPFVHLPTGGQVMVPARIDPLTGERRILTPVHPDIVPVHDCDA